ncbi:MAG TPA: endonuclease, partial [Arthrobacter sp.]|nr:endonuclease [Arthrobacter sp.]
MAASVAASVAALAVFTGAGADSSDASGADPFRDVEADSPWADPLRDLADSCLDGLAGMARLEAQTAALKVWL